MSKNFPEKQSGFLRFAVDLDGGGSNVVIDCFSDQAIAAATEVDSQRFGPTNPIPQVGADGTKQVATSILGPKGSPIVGIPASCNFQAQFVATDLADVHADAGLVTVVLTPEYDNGVVTGKPNRFITGLLAEVTNNSIPIDDTANVKGWLYVEIEHTYYDRIPPHENGR